MAGETGHGGLRYYVVLRAQGDELATDYFHPDRSRAIEAITKYLASAVSAPPGLAGFSVVNLPSRGDHVVAKRRTLRELVAALSIPDAAWLRLIGAAMANDPEKFAGGGADIPFSLADHWCPREATDPIFADRAAAERLIGVPHLKCKRNLSGQDVNVVIVDQGLDRDELGPSYVDGWAVGDRQPGTTPATEPDSGRPSHGMMMARNILSVAPDARLFDLPIAPRKISDIPAFLSQADAPFRDMIADIVGNSGPGRQSGSWVLVNPWGIHDTRSDLDPPFDYVNNPDHVFNKCVAEAAGKGIDIVFAAGNCGQFCPDGRCGPTSYGPGHSIHGANSLPEVLTVGAVRADGMWLGYSSQGPGRSRLATDKPDLCVSSQFRETHDARAVNTGTSAACGLAAGVIAALRSRWPSSPQLPPAELITVLRETARHPRDSFAKDRFGSGILNVEAALARLEQTCAEGDAPA